MHRIYIRYSTASSSRCSSSSGRSSSSCQKTRVHKCSLYQKDPSGWKTFSESSVHFSSKIPIIWSLLAARSVSNNALVVASSATSVFYCCNLELLKFCAKGLYCYSACSASSAPLQKSWLFGDTQLVPQRARAATFPEAIPATARNNLGSSILPQT